MNALREWFDTLAPRERLMVSVAAVLVLIALFYYALWRPLNNARADARTQVTAESNQTRWMLGVRSDVQLLRSSSRQSAPTGQGQSLLSIVDQTSRANNLGDAVTHIQPQNNDKTIVTLDKANFNRMLFWLRSLQSQYGVIASEASISREDDAPGRVEARLTLVRGAS